MFPGLKSAIIFFNLCLFLTVFSPVVAGNDRLGKCEFEKSDKDSNFGKCESQSCEDDKGKCEESRNSQCENDNGKCDGMGKNEEGKCEDPNGKFGQSGEEEKECAAYLKKEAAKFEQKAQQSTGEEAGIYHKLARCLTDGSAEKEKMAQAKRNQDPEAYKKSEEACQKLIQKNGQLCEQLKKIKGPAGSNQKSGALAQSSGKEKILKDHNGNETIESDADMKRWLSEDGLSKK